MSKKLLWIIAFVSSLTLNSMVFADSSFCRESLNKMVQSLKLDDSQKAKIKPIVDQLKSDMKNTGSQMDGLEDQLTQQVNSANMDNQQVNDLVDKKTKLIGDMMKAKAKATNQIFAVLKPEQKTKLQGMIKKAEDRIAYEFKKCVQD